MDNPKTTQNRLDGTGDALDAPLADRDHWEAETAVLRLRLASMTQVADAAEAEAQRWRARSPVTAEDVERAGVTHTRCWRWLVRMGFSQSSPAGCRGFYHLIGNWGPVLAHGCPHTDWTSEHIAQIINTTSWRGPARAILAEMAAINPED